MNAKDIALVKKYSSHLIDMYERMNHKQIKLVGTIITTSLDIIHENQDHSV